MSRSNLMSLNETLYMLEHLRLCPKPFPRSSGVSTMTCACPRAFRKLLECAYRADIARCRGRENGACIHIMRGVQEGSKIDDLDGFASGIELPLSGSPEQDVFSRSRPAAHELFAVPQVFHLALQSISSPGLLVVWLCVCVCVCVLVCVYVCVFVCVYVYDQYTCVWGMRLRKSCWRRLAMTS